MAPSTVYLPLVRCNAFVGLEEYNERVQTFYFDALRKSQLDSPTISKRNMKRQREPSTPSVSDYQVSRGDNIIGLDQPNKRVKTSTENDREEPEKTDIATSMKRKRENDSSEALTSSKDMYCLSNFYTYKDPKPSKIRRKLDILNTNIDVFTSCESSGGQLVRYESFIRLDLLTTNCAASTSIASTESQLVRCDSVVRPELLTANFDASTSLVSTEGQPITRDSVIRPESITSSKNTKFTTFLGQHVMKMKKALKKCSTWFSTKS